MCQSAKAIESPNHTKLKTTYKIYKVLLWAIKSIGKHATICNWWGKPFCFLSFGCKVIHFRASTIASLFSKIFCWTLRDLISKPNARHSQVISIWIDPKMFASNISNANPMRINSSTLSNLWHFSLDFWLIFKYNMQIAKIFHSVQIFII